MNRSRRLFNISTGYRVIDCLFPVAHGQRELIIGDRQTGKSTLALTSTINQISMSYEYPIRYTMIGVYVATAQKCTNIMRFSLSFRWIVDRFCFTPLREHCPVHGFTVYIAYVWHMSIRVCEEQRLDLSHFVWWPVQARCRLQTTVSFLRKPAGREAYPSDVFIYIPDYWREHAVWILRRFRYSRLLSYHRDTKQWSLGICRYQCHFDYGWPALPRLIAFGMGICPAISVDKSVSRVGAKSLDPIMRAVAFRIYLLINEYKQESSAAVKSTLLSSGSTVETGWQSFYTTLTKLWLS